MSENQEPYQNSLYMDCFLELLEKKRKEGEQSLSFKEVDAYVVEKAKLITDYKKPEEVES